MRISVRYPGVRTDDLRITVTLQELGTPWPVRFHFLNTADTDTGVREFVHVGFEVGERFEKELATGLEPSGSVTLATDPEPLDPVAVQRIASNYASYLELARHAIVLEEEGIDGAIRRLRPGRKPARLTDDFYRLIAEDFRARRDVGGAPVKELAAAHHVDISTASRWVKEARKRGFLESADG